MPTTAERNALTFLAALAVVGGGVRWSEARRFDREVARAVGDTLATDRRLPTDRAVAGQLAAVDSVRATRAERRTRRSSGSQRRAHARSSSDPEQRPIPPPRNVAPSRDAPLDINAATAADLERLPRVGPVLARRIIAWRDSAGPFGSLEAFRHVPGIGPVTASLVAPLVTFSSGYRPSVR